jgi:hypothetical protein
MLLVFFEQIILILFLKVLCNGYNVVSNLS